MRKIKGLRWYMIALVTLGTVLGYSRVTPWQPPRPR